MSSDGQHRRRVILGLGNPGERYAATRHNVGFRVVEELARRRGLRLVSGECNCELGKASARGQEDSLFLVAPQTYMNRSGYAARCLAERHEIEAQDFLVVYDEIHLPVGKLRLRRRGSPAGHRGMESVIENLGTDRVPRLRLGVSGDDEPAPGEELVDFVLSPFDDDEIEAVDAMIVRAAEACEAWVTDGIDTAMQQFNG